MNWLGAYIQPELCSNLLQGFCLPPPPPFFFFYLYSLRDLVSNIHPSGKNLVTLSFSFVTYTHLRDLVMSVAWLVTYIR